MGEGARGILWVLVMQRQPAQPLADVVHRCSWRVVVHAAGGGVLAVEQRADTDVPAADERSAHRSVHTHTTCVQPYHAKCDLSRLSGALLYQFCFSIFAFPLLLKKYSDMEGHSLETKLEHNDY